MTSPDGRPAQTRVVTPEVQERLATALEEAATRVRQCRPEMFEFDYEDDVDRIMVGNGEFVEGMRSPLRRRFNIEW